MSNYLSFKIPRLAIFVLTLFLTLSPISIPNKVEAATGFSLDPGTSHIGWPFTGGSSWDNKTASYGDGTQTWRTVSGSTLHGGSDIYADDWVWGNGNSCGKDVVAPFSGNVIYKGQGYNAGDGKPSAYGYEVIIQADANSNYAWRAAHLQAGSTTNNSRVNAGDYIGKVGSTGTGSCHLHSVLYKNIHESSSQGGSGYSRLVNWGTTIDTLSGTGNKFAVAFYSDGTTGGNPQPTDCNNVGSYNGVRLYQQDACNGSPKEYSSPTGSNPVNLGDSGWNDKVQSVYIASGWSLRVYEHSNGEGKDQCLEGHKWDLDKDSWRQGGAIGSQTSSIIVFNKPGCPATVQPPGTPSLSSPNNGEIFTNQQQINLSWSGNGSEYYVEINGGPTGSFNTGWISETSKNIGTQWAGYSYSWRVKARNSAGESGFSSSRTFTVNQAVQIPNAPSLSSPSNGATFTNEQQINLSWSGNGNEYYVEISGGPTGSFNTGWISETSRNIGTQWAGHTYTWRVKARNSAGEGSWSSSRTFTVNQAVQIPSAPSLVSPNGNASFTDIQAITLSWSGNGSEYYVEITGGPTPLNTGWISGTSANIGTQWSGHTYSWRVKARNSAGEGPWSSTRTFTVVPHVQVPNAPSLSSPANGASFTDAQAISLSWSGNGVEYYAEISGGPAGTINTGWISGTTSNIGTQWAGHTYTWRVKSRNSAGEGSWSGTRSFSVTQAVQIPTAPSLNSPSNNATFFNNQDIDLSWSGNGTEYYVEVDGPLGVTITWGSGTTRTIGPRNSGSYTWRVKARNSAGEGPWSNTRSFTVTQAPDTTPPTGVVTSPAKDSTQNGPNILLKANASDNKSGVKKVQFYAWSDHTWSNSNWILLGGDNTAPYEYNWDVSALGAETYAFVSIVVTDNADNSTGILGDTAWTHFSIRNTAITAPAAPTLSSPANDSGYGVGQNVQLSWSGSGTEYFGEVTGGPNGTVTFGWQATTNKTYNNLPGGYVYTWKVKARNSAGESPWSSTRTFTVGDCNNISGGTIKLFANQNCQGSVHNAVSGFTNLTNFNDTAESMYVPSGISARIWSDANRGGATRCITSTMWNFNIDNYENGTKISTNGSSTVSSIEVFNSENCTPTVVATGCDAVNANGVTLFTGNACKGESMNVTTAGFVKLAKPNNNAFRSIFIRAGWSIKVFANKDKTGGKKCIKATVKNLAKETYNTGEAIVVDGKSTISAFEVYNSVNCK